jgi:hypothetical protein
MSRPEGMTRDAWARVRALSERQRELVLERAALIYYGSADVPWPDADERAYVLEIGGQHALFGRRS